MSTRGWGAGLDSDPALAVRGQADETRFSVARKTITDSNIRCRNEVPVPHEPGEFRPCNRLLIQLAGRPWRVQCPRCKAINESPPL